MVIPLESERTIFNRRFVLFEKTPGVRYLPQGKSLYRV